MKIAWIQYDIIWQNGKLNLEKIEDFVHNYEGTFDLLILPEMFDTGFAMNPSGIQRDQDEILSWIQGKSIEWTCAIMGSSITKEHGKYFNRLYFTNGSELRYYDKNYLFGMGGEGKNYTPGKERVVMKLNEMSILPLICYDLRFPEIARHNGEVDFIIYVASWPVTRIQHWMSLLQARAIENQSYVLGVNRLGEDGNGLHYNGMSTLFSYDGSQIQTSSSKEGIFSQSIDTVPLHNYREKFPFLQDMKK